ncbi:MAG: glycosyltransferase [Gemmatimonadetes bacterium]|nr:glycosyltransferase [Gemmatimonadota bacterium]
MSEPRFSMVIPAWNEAAYLPRLLRSVAEARRRYPRGPDQIEVIVADNGSSDATVPVARDAGCRVVEVAPRVIAAVRNGGAAQARGSVLVFIDADSRLHPDTFAAIDRSLATGRVVAGATGVTMDRWSVGIGLTYAMMMPMVWLTGMDTGAVFIRRDDFTALGGYRERFRFAEDVDLLLRARALGRGREPRASLTRLRGVKAVTSTRKFDVKGDWHYFGLMARVGVDLVRRREGVATSYWYGEGLRPPPRP